MRVRDIFCHTVRGAMIRGVGLEGYNSKKRLRDKINLNNLRKRRIVTKNVGSYDKCEGAEGSKGHTRPGY